MKVSDFSFIILLLIVRHMLLSLSVTKHSLQVMKSFGVLESTVPDRIWEAPGYHILCLSRLPVLPMLILCRMRPSK